MLTGLGWSGPAPWSHQMVVGVVHKRACVLKEQGACIRGGKRTIVLPPCPLQATAISFDSFKVERENQNKTLLLFCTVKADLLAAAWWWGLALCQWSCAQAAWMHIMTTIEQRSTVEPWKPSGRGWEFLGWRSSEYFPPLSWAAWGTAPQLCQPVFVVLFLLLCCVQL